MFDFITAAPVINNINKIFTVREPLHTQSTTYQQVINNVNSNQWITLVCKLS